MLCERVALIEDDDETRASCAEALRRAGIEVSAYRSCHEAIAALGAGTLPSLIVIDLEMPGESTFDAMQTIRACISDAMLIAFTGHAGDAWLFSALVAGCVGYVLKTDASLSIVEADRKSVV